MYKTILLTIFTLLLAGNVYGFDLDLDSNDAVDVAFGGCNAKNVADCRTNIGLGNHEQITVQPNGDSNWPLVNDAATPTINFGDGDTGFYESADDTVIFASAGNIGWQFNASILGATGNNYPLLYKVDSTDTVPNILSDYQDTNTGIGSNGLDELSLIAGGVELIRLDEDTVNTITANAHTIIAGTDPTLSTCGTAPSVTGSDNAGIVTTDTDTNQACTITFAEAWTNSPACVVSAGNTNVYGYVNAVSTTAVTFNFSGNLNSSTFHYICIGL